MKVTKRFALAAAGLGVAGTLIGASVANADPTAPPANHYDRPLHGVGSDTTDLVMNGLAEVVVGDHDGDPATANQKLLASWDAKSSAGFKTRATGCEYTGNPTPDAAAYVEGARANGSGNGQRALRDAFTAGKATFGCLDFSRSSSNPSAGNLGTVQVKAIHLAEDGLAIAVHKSTVLPKSFTKTQLQNAYKCSFGGFSTGAWKAIIPQAGSGTRSSWLAFVGQTEAALADPAAFPCVTDQNDLGPRGGSNPIQEHDLRSLTSNALAPVSTAQWIAQMGGAATDVRGSSILGAIKGPGTTNPEVSYAIQMNTSYGDLVGTTDDLITRRTVYNVVPTQELQGGSSVNPLSVLVFQDTDPDPAVNTSLICQRADVIKKFGFAPIATCGTGSNVNPS